MSDNKRLVAYVRLTKDEYEKVKISSQSTGKTVPTLLKEAFLKGGIVIPKFSNDDTRVLARHLSSIGNNLNQIARHLNSGLREGWCLDFERVCKEFTDFKSFLANKNGKSARPYS